MIPKFRAWDKEHDEMLYPDNVDKIYFEITVDGIVTYDMRYILPYDDIPPYLDTVIMQSTGLADVNGKEIFEGDILKSPYGFIGKVNIVEGAWYVQHSDFTNNHFLYVAQGKSVIIGNIHEHSHLLDDGGNL
ncbi:YopX family protein [Macrococcoides caseolyticum]|uniref:YopX family protein n=1 Tax=Macrococcoides caseolyticum TaxID=69966 RepID=UPI000C336A31|nr:YopX family protein [Macrococcus caseolyticus]PKE18673.1 hypothetical protein CW679_09720 [Macrococcus caseolyticus]PKF41677.1 hypothetical protein CW661_00645 [Macrococcus caseolyticus]